jgi:hypothetical protein
LTDGLSWASGWQESYTPPSKSAIFQARARLGSEPVAALFTRVAKPLGVAGTPGTWLAGRRLVAIDGTCLDVADTPANAEHFGRPGVTKGERAAFPQARVVALAECGTHAMFAAKVGTYGQSEATLTEPLLQALEPGMLLTADRAFFSYALWRRAIGTGADLLWSARVPSESPIVAAVSRLAELPGIPEQVEAAREACTRLRSEACTRLRWHQALRKSVPTPVASWRAPACRSTSCATWCGVRPPGHPIPTRSS